MNRKRRGERKNGERLKSSGGPLVQGEVACVNTYVRKMVPKGISVMKILYKCFNIIPIIMSTRIYIYLYLILVFFSNLFFLVIFNVYHFVCLSFS